MQGGQPCPGARGGRVGHLGAQLHSQASGLAVRAGAAATPGLGVVMPGLGCCSEVLPLKKQQIYPDSPASRRKEGSERVACRLHIVGLLTGSSSYFSYRILELFNFSLLS